MAENLNLKDSNVSIEGHKNIVLQNLQDCRISIGSTDNNASNSSRNYLNHGKEEELGRQLDAHLKSHYRFKMEIIDLMPWHKDDLFSKPLMDVYTKLELVKTGYYNEEVTPMSCCSFRDKLSEVSKNEIPLKILVDGPPGIGKSTLFRKMALDWALGNEDSLKGYKFLILIEGRNFLSVSNLIDAIFDQLLPCESYFKFTKPELHSYLQENDADILFLIDGFDEVKDNFKKPILDLLNQKLFCRSHVIISTRDNKREELIKITRQRFVIKGFSHEEVILYVNRFFQGQRDGNLLAERIKTDGNIRDIAQNPLATVLLCLLWKDCFKTDSRELPSSLTKLYNALLIQMTKRHCERKNIRGDDYRNLLISLGKLSFSIRKNNDSFRFNLDQLRQANLDGEFLELGILTKEYNTSLVVNETCWISVHMSLLEFVIAFYLVESEQYLLENITNQLVNEENLHTVCMFTVGLLGERSRNIFHNLGVAFRSLTTNSAKYPVMVELSLSCLYESGCAKDFCGQIINFLVENNQCLNLIEATYKPGTLMGLAKVIEEQENQNKQNKIITRVFLSRISPLDRSTNYKAFFKAIRKSKYIKDLRIYMTSEVVHDFNEVANNHDTPLKGLHITIRYKHRTNLDLDFILQMSSSFAQLQLKSFGIQLIEEIEYNTKLSEKIFPLSPGKALCISDSVVYFSIGGSGSLVDQLYCETKEKITLHPKIRGIRQYSHNSLYEKDRLLATCQIFKKNMKLNKIIIGSDDFCIGFEKENAVLIESLIHGQVEYPAMVFWSQDPARKKCEVCNIELTISDADRPWKCDPNLYRFDQYTNILKMGKKFQVALLISPYDFTLTSHKNVEITHEKVMERLQEILHSGSFKAFVFIKLRSWKFSQLKNISVPERFYTFVPKSNEYHGISSLALLIIAIEDWFVEITQYESKINEANLKVPIFAVSKLKDISKTAFGFDFYFFLDKKIFPEYTFSSSFPNETAL